MLSEDRKNEGLAGSMSIADNLCISKLPRFVRPSKLTKFSEELISKLGIRCQSPNQEIQSLSGGNQQKVALAKWLMLDPKVLLLDEPTRGIDVGAKFEIYDLVRRLADQGMSIILVSSELAELIGLSDRILVLSQGQLTGEFERGKVDQETLMHAMTQ